MENMFSKIVAVFIAIYLLFINPLLYMAQKQDTISQLYVQNQTVEFIDSIKNSGYVSRAMYQEFTRQIDNTGNLYNIEIVHSHRKVEPNLDIETNEILDGYHSYFYNTYQEEIMEAFDDGNDYYFSQGDYISITVVNRNKTMSTRIMEGLYKKALAKEQIIVTYGGMIRDEVD